MSNSMEYKPYKPFSAHCPAEAKIWVVGLSLGRGSHGKDIMQDTLFSLNFVNIKFRENIKSHIS